MTALLEVKGLKAFYGQTQSLYDVGFEIPDAPGNYWYVWFDAPIGYISISANYDDQWREWYLNEAHNVEWYQFMGKDNITFHTVIFPSTLIGTGKPWTKLHHVSTTEFLN